MGLKRFSSHCSIHTHARTHTYSFTPEPTLATPRSVVDGKLQCGRHMHLLITIADIAHTTALRDSHKQAL